MAKERALLRKPAAGERRPAAAVVRAASKAAPSHAMPPARTLQHRLGNQGTQAFAARAVARAAAPGMPSAGGAATGQLSVSQPGDAHEVEADRMADAVMSAPSPHTNANITASPQTASRATTHRTCAQCDDESEQKGGGLIHREPSSTSPIEVASAAVATNIHAMEGGGHALPETTRAYFEPRFGANLSHVRVHTGGRAEQTAKSINAKAFTVGPNIAFGSGHYSPESQEGRKLLAHELTHVMQQDRGPAIQRDVLDDVGDAVSSVAGTVSDVASDAVDVVSDVASGAANKVSDLVSDAADAVTGVVDTLIGKLRGAFDSALGQINAAWARVKTGVTEAIDGALGKVGRFLGGIAAFFGPLAVALSSLNAGSLRAAWAAITRTADAALAGVRNLVAMATMSINTLWSGLKGFATGLIAGFQRQANGLIAGLPGPAQGPARGLWTKIEGKLTGAWRAIESVWISIRASALKRANQVVATVVEVVKRIKTSVIASIIATLEQLQGLFTFVRKVMANPDIVIDPLVKEIVRRLQPLPDKAQTYIESKVPAQAGRGPGAAPAASSMQGTIQRDAASVVDPRSTLGVGEVISGCWDAIVDKLKGLWAKLGETVKKMVLSLVWPPATIEALKEDWTHMTGELDVRAKRWESIRTDSAGAFFEDLGRYLSNLADYVLIVWRGINAILGHLSVYIGLAIVLGGVVIGGISGATGGAIFGSIVPVAGTGAGGLAGFGAGLLAGASAGYAAAETVGLIMLASFVIAEEISIFKALGDLLGLPQTKSEQEEDFNQIADSTIAILTALLLMGIAFIGSALARRVWALIKGIYFRIRPPKPKVPDAPPGAKKAAEPPKAKAGDPGQPRHLSRLRRCARRPGGPHGATRETLTRDAGVARCRGREDISRSRQSDAGELQGAARLHGRCGQERRPGKRLAREGGRSRRRQSHRADRFRRTHHASRSQCEGRRRRRSFDRHRRGQDRARQQGARERAGRLRGEGANGRPGQPRFFQGEDHQRRQIHDVPR